MWPRELAEEHPAPWKAWNRPALSQSPGFCHHQLRGKQGLPPHGSGSLDGTRSPRPGDLPDSWLGTAGLGHQRLLGTLKGPPLQSCRGRKRLIFNGSRKHNSSTRAQGLLAEAVGSSAGTGGAWDEGACWGVLVAAGAGTGSAGFQGHLHWEMVTDSQSLHVRESRVNLTRVNS